MNTLFKIRKTISFAMALSVGTVHVTAQIAFADTKLDTPILTQTSGIAGAPGNSTASRNISWNTVTGAESYNLYVYNNLSNARAAENPIAVVNIPHSNDENITMDFRQIMFTEIGGSGVTVSAEIINDENFTRALHTSGNLKPGSYWLRVQAIASDESRNSELSDLPLNRQDEMLALEDLPIVIALGPSEQRELIETRYAEIGTPSLRLLDIRPNIPFTARYYFEIWTEGWNRYLTERMPNIHWGVEEQTGLHGMANTEFMTDTEVFTALPDRDATILVMCRGAGRSRQAVERLTMLGYTNILDAQGINQWKYGRVYDPSLHPDSSISTGDWEYTVVRNLTVNTEENTLAWTNVTGAESFMVYTFDNAEETNTANAVASAIILREHNPYLGSQMHQTVTFDLNELYPALSANGAYFYRIQAMSQEHPVRGQEPLTWGAHSPLSTVARVAGSTGDNQVPETSQAREGLPLAAQGDG